MTPRIYGVLSAVASAMWVCNAFASATVDKAVLIRGSRMIVPRQTSSCPSTCSDLIDAITQCGPSGTAQADEITAPCICDGGIRESLVNQCYHCGSPGLTDSQISDVAYFYGSCQDVIRPITKPSKSIPVGAIVGGVLGGIVFLGLLGGLLTWCILRRRHQREERHAMLPSPSLRAPATVVNFPAREDKAHDADSWDVAAAYNYTPGTGRGEKAEIESFDTARAQAQAGEFGPASVYGEGNSPAHETESSAEGDYNGRRGHRVL